MAEKYLPNTPVGSVIADLEQRSACAEGVSWCRKFLGRTWGELADNADKEIDAGYDQSWSVWFLRLFGAVTNTEIRKRFIAGIHDSMMAFLVYIKAVWLTDEEDKLIEAKFEGKLPRAEAELAQGIVKRKKTT